ncbi:MAG: NADH-quinone oxidoreductase subunit N [Chloroflexi bacterium]|nr:NADH-quinone oxidoreductase subunit N [Chloroflexota bacterium]|tara:strand:- start:35 stop:1543 length:1509 start_codon:yes stop_codon:yes gene_type:complete
MTAQDFWVLSPEIAMALLVLLVVTVDLVTRSMGKVATVAFIGLAAPAVLALNLWFGWFGDPATGAAVFGTFESDRFSLFFKFLLLVVTAGTILASVKYISSDRVRSYGGEFISLVLLSVTGMMILVSATELITIYVALELTALPVVALAAIHRSKQGVEAGTKFFVLSAISSAILLYGFAYIYGYTGSTNLDVIMDRLAVLPTEAGVPFGSYAVLLAVIMITAGFGFKMAVVPWQMWVPDVYQGAPTPVVAFLSVASKSAAFAVVMRVMYTAFGDADLMQDWSGLFAILAAVTMTLGNTLALSQSNIKRLLGYSTIAQAGYILVGLASVPANQIGASAVGAGPQGAMYYLAGYAFTNLAVFFAIIAITSRTNDDSIEGLNGLLKRSPLLAGLLVFGILSLLGMPPTVGFMAKVVVFGAAVNANLTWLAVVGVINTVIAAYYYLRVIRAIVFEDPANESTFGADKPLLAATAIAAVGAGVFGIAPFLLLDLADKALTIVPALS